MSDERLTELEIRLAYQEDTLQALSETVARQQADMDRLERMNKELYARVRELAEQARDSAGAAPPEKPPHY